MSALLVILAAATIPLRNPFWPVGHRGTPEAIGDEPRVRAAAEQAAAEEEEADTGAGAAALAAAAAQDADDAQAAERRWIAARKSLRIGGLMKSSGDANRQSVAINGYVYGDGDLVSVNHDGWRFTWRVKRLTENKTLQLVRIRARELDPDDEPGGRRR